MSITVQAPGHHLSKVLANVALAHCQALEDAIYGKELKNDVFHLFDVGVGEVIRGYDHRWVPQVR